MRITNNSFQQFFKIFALGIILFFSNKATAQVLPPDFLCVRSDTLFWNVPINNCGPFNSYEVFVSDNPTSGFSLLTTVTNQGQNFYHHPNPLGEVLYYYVQSDHNCPGEVVLQSDTLDNRQPEVAVIRVASVVGNTIELSWNPSPSPEVFGYIIFRNTPLGTVALDTVFAGTTYVDFNASPDVQSETYFIIALDECGNTSIFNEPHTTVFLTQTVAPCEQSINLSWNLYEGWENEIESQEVWVSVNGNPATSVASIGGTQTTYSFVGASDTQVYCFFIKSIEAITGEETRSNEICLTPDLVVKNDFLFLKNVNVLPDNSVELTWNWNSDAELQTVETLSSSDNITFTSVSTLPAPSLLNVESSLVDNISNPSSGKIFFKIRTRDDCDALALSNYGSTIHLQGSAQPGLSNFLTWSAFDLEGVTLLDYDIYRIVGGNISFLANVPVGTTTYSDVVDPEKEAESNVCYYVVANTEITLPNGNIERLASTSNIKCVEQLTSIIAPNAFAPQGRNQIFRPLVIFGETVDYQLNIFNRWGELIFETKDKDQGWNGKYKGTVQPMGAYVFHVKIIQASGRVVEEKGVFTLLR
ncbi:MAG: T9SS type B sorting domain-containing protein [Bacteroidota bacterium]